MSRSNPTHRGELPALATLAIGLMAAGAAQATIVEHGVDTAGATGAVAIAYGDHTLNAGLASALETDAYTFLGRAGESVRIQLLGLTANLDPTIVLRGLAGAVIGSTSCSSNSISICSVELTRTLPATATYTINISDSGVDNGGQYQFHLDEHPPTSRLTSLQYGSLGTVNTALQHTTDVDSFSFMAGAGSGIRIAVGTDTVNIDPRLQLWAPDGSQIKTAGCDSNSISTCTTLIDLDVTTTGIYKLSVADGGWDNGGNYSISLSCTYGFDVCPPVPEPQTYALLAGGLGMLGLALRRRRSSYV